MPEVKIIGTGSYIPSTTVKNKDLEGELDFDEDKAGGKSLEEWIWEKEGIKERHYATEESKLEECVGTDRKGNKIIRRIGPSTYMAYMAILDTLKSAGIEINDEELAKFDRIHVGTFSDLWIINNCGGKVAWRLAHVGTPASTGNEACAGFLYGVEDIYNGIKAGRYEKGIACGSETLSSVRTRDPKVGSLWGDAAGAMAFEASDEKGVYPPYLDSIDSPNIELMNPNNLESIIIDGKEYVPKTYIEMQGEDVFKKAVQAMVRATFCALVHYKFGRAGERYTKKNRPRFIKSYRSVKEEFNRIGKKIIKEIAGIFLHQANYRIDDTVAVKELGLDRDMMYVTIDKLANPSSASIPASVDLAVKDGFVKKNKVYAVAGVGGSYPGGAFVFRWLK